MTVIVKGHKNQTRSDILAMADDFMGPLTDLEATYGIKKISTPDGDEW